ncbi:hypothetical protein F0562_029618 [Nyssa sinensis]|uniref:Uncharacterized protein n=1 Tax=Nyssa sinensis TaxID=561372 RepID=A0A5J5B4K2_9ASTE|nr:hypothetical protein F0562_029618 [Nyssa sinensis]
MWDRSSSPPGPEGEKVKIVELEALEATKSLRSNTDATISVIRTKISKKRNTTTPVTFITFACILPPPRHCQCQHQHQQRDIDKDGFTTVSTATCSLLTLSLLLLSANPLLLPPPPFTFAERLSCTAPPPSKEEEHGRTCLRSQIERVLELLRKNRDMLFSEVKLTVLIEDPREVERRRLIGIDDSDSPTRDDLVATLEEVNEGKIPKDRVALRILAEEMIQWPNLEVEAPKPKPRKSLYAKATDTGVDPQVAAKRLNIDWDSAAEIENADVNDDTEVPPAVGYGALYLVTAFPVIIGFHTWFHHHLVSVFHPLIAMMILAASDLVLHPQSDAQEADGVSVEAADVCMTLKNLQDSEFLTVEEPRTLVKRDSLQKEKQISVDPISLKESASCELVLPPVVTTAPKANAMSFPPTLPRAKPKFFSSSLPGSATSSPRFSSTMLKKKWRNQGQAINSLARQHSVALTNLSRLRESHLRRSKSCGEGRACAPSDEFDVWLNRVNSNGDDYSSPCKTEAKIKMDGLKNGKEMDDPRDEKFKCGALCLFLPGFGKGKPVRARKDEMEMEHVVSRTVSLEKFECGSWTSSAIMKDNEEKGESGNLYFDLPLELIRTSVNEAHSPVTAAFVFDKDQKGVLKKITSRGRKSQESSRHVRFSVSSPTSNPSSPSTCITPRLRKAREEFNAFLEAQSA